MFLVSNFTYIVGGMGDLVWGRGFFPASGDRFFPRHLTVKDFSPALYATRDNFFQCKINFYPGISLQDLFFPLEIGLEEKIHVK